MLGHLVFGRYGSAGERETHANRTPSHWMERMFSALFRRKH